MELEKYIKSIGKTMPMLLQMLSNIETNDDKYAFATGSEEYPSTIKETLKRIKDMLWQKK